MKMSQRRHGFHDQIFFVADILNRTDFYGAPLVASQPRQRVAWAAHSLALSVAPGAGDTTGCWRLTSRVLSVKELWVNIYQPRADSLPGYGAVAYGNRRVRTRLLGGVGAGGEKPPATRFEYYAASDLFNLSASQILIIDCRGTPRRLASLSND